MLINLSVYKTQAPENHLSVIAVLKKEFIVQNIRTGK
jgi:hypothetical protein